jgi:hypothetical protein
VLTAERARADLPLGEQTAKRLNTLAQLLDAEARLKTA